MTRLNRRSRKRVKMFLRTTDARFTHFTRREMTLYLQHRPIDLSKGIGLLDGVSYIETVRR